MTIIIPSGKYYITLRGKISKREFVIIAVKIPYFDIDMESYVCMQTISGYESYSLNDFEVINLEYRTE